MPQYGAAVDAADAAVSGPAIAGVAGPNATLPKRAAPASMTDVRRVTRILIFFPFVE